MFSFETLESKALIKSQNNFILVKQRHVHFTKETWRTEPFTLPAQFRNDFTEAARSELGGEGCVGICQLRQGSCCRQKASLIKDVV